MLQGRKGLVALKELGSWFQRKRGGPGDKKLGEQMRAQRHQDSDKKLRLRDMDQDADGDQDRDPRKAWREPHRCRLVWAEQKLGSGEQSSGGPGR